MNIDDAVQVLKDAVSFNHSTEDKHVEAFVRLEEENGWEIIAYDEDSEPLFTFNSSCKTLEMALREALIQLQKNMRPKAIALSEITRRLDDVINPTVPAMERP